MATSLWCPDRERPDFRDGQYPQSYLILSLSTVFCKRRRPTESATKQEPRAQLRALDTRRRVFLLNRIGWRFNGQKGTMNHHRTPSVFYGDPNFCLSPVD
jgi:hypothetical protein